MSKPYDRSPVNRFRVSQLLWVLLASVAVTGLTLCALTVSSNLSVNSALTYPGTLTPDRELTSVTLPAGIPLKSVLVQAGETVRIGQTVALLDTDVMAAKLTLLTREIQVATVLRECLLKTKVSPPAISAPPGMPPHLKRRSPEDTLDRETYLLMRAALAECAKERRIAKVQIARMQAATLLLQERVGLLDKKLSMILTPGNSGSVQNGANSFLRAHASLAVSLERNALRQQIQALESELNALRVDLDSARLNRVRKLSDEVATKLLQQEVFAHYLEEPRLQAPEAGTISRIRPLMAGAFHSLDENLLELRSEAAALYSAEMELPNQEGALLLPGTAVEIRLLGFTERGPKLHGKVVRLIRSERVDNAETVVALIDLSADSQSVLANPENGIALRGRATASAIRVRQSSQSLRVKLAQVWSRHTSAIPAIALR